MKKIACVIVVALFPLFAFSQYMQPSFMDISIGGTGGFLLSGDQKTLLEDNLSPTPDKFNMLAATASITCFPHKNFGVKISTRQFGVVNADSSKITTALKCYDVSSYNLGLAGRYFIGAEEGTNLSAILASAGINYATLKYDSEYEDLILGSLPSGYYLYDLKSEIGFYASLGAVYYFAKHFLVGANIEYVMQNNKIDVSNKDLNGNYLFFEFNFGFSI